MEHPTRKHLPSYSIKWISLKLSSCLSINSVRKNTRRWIVNMKCRIFHSFIPRSWLILKRFWRKTTFNARYTKRRKVSIFKATTDRSKMCSLFFNSNQSDLFDDRWIFEHKKNDWSQLLLINRFSIASFSTMRKISVKTSTKLSLALTVTTSKS